MDNSETNPKPAIEDKSVLTVFEHGEDVVQINSWNVYTDVITHKGIQEKRRKKIEEGISINSVYGGFTESPQTKINLIKKSLSTLTIPIKKNGLSVLGTAWPLVFLKELAPQKWDGLDINPFEIDDFTRRNDPNLYPQLRLHYGDILNLSDEYFKTHFKFKDILDLSNIPDIVASEKYGTGDFSMLNSLINQLITLTESTNLLLSFSSQTTKIGEQLLIHLQERYPKIQFILEKSYYDGPFSSSWNKHDIHNIMRYHYTILIDKSPTSSKSEPTDIIVT